MLFLFFFFGFFVSMEENYSEYTLDHLDLRIVACLQQNAKLTAKELAEKIGLTQTPTYERVKRLERRGIIEGYTIRVNSKKMGFGLKVMCSISLQSHSRELIEQFEQKITELKEVKRVFHLAGNTDYTLFIEIEDMETYAEFVKKKLASIPNISTVQSSFVLNELV